LERDLRVLWQSDQGRRAGRARCATARYLLGILVSAASGFWAIGFLLNFLKRRDVTPFVVWRIAVALAVFGLALTGLFDSP
jgi:undecaprenyl pyrophosphate phosphatase UppP